MASIVFLPDARSKKQKDMSLRVHNANNGDQTKIFGVILHQAATILVAGEAFLWIIGVWY